MIHFTFFVSGELIGVQYLFHQTGNVPQDMDPASLETTNPDLIEEHADDVEEDEGFSDLTDHDIISVLLPEVLVAPASSTAAGPSSPTGNTALLPGVFVAPAPDSPDSPTPGPSTSSVTPTTAPGK